MSNFYNLDISTLKTLLLPTFERTPRTLAFINALVNPFVSIYERFILFKEDTTYRQGITSQVCYLQKLLNDSFDPIERRIYINNIAAAEPIWFYEPEDEIPVFFYEPADDNPVIFYEPGDFALYSPSFTVFLPIEIQNASPEEEQTFIKTLRGSLDTYKLYSKNYNIEYYG